MQYGHIYITSLSRKRSTISFVKNYKHCDCANYEVMSDSVHMVGMCTNEIMGKNQSLSSTFTTS